MKEPWFRDLLGKIRGYRCGLFARGVGRRQRVEEILVELRFGWRRPVLVDPRLDFNPLVPERLAEPVGPLPPSCVRSFPLSVLRPLGHSAPNSTDPQYPDGTSKDLLGTNRWALDVCL